MILRPSKFITYAILSCLLFITQNMRAETLNVGFINVDRLPYFAHASDEQPLRGLYFDILEKIGKSSGIEFSYLFIPQARIRLHMNKGLLDVEPGIDKSWRTEQDEVENSVYSLPFMQSPEVIAYNKKKYPNFSITQPNLTNCAVLGFNTFEKDKISELLSESQMLDMIHNQRCDKAVLPTDVLKYYLTQNKYDIAYTQPVKTYSLRLRIHKSKQHLLARINASIKQMLDSGEFQKLYNKYTIKNG